MQEKTAFEDTKSTTSYATIQHLPADKLSSRRKLTTAHSTECENKNLEAQQELQCISPLSTDNQRSVVNLSLQHLPCGTLSASATSHAIPHSPFRMQMLWLAQELFIPSALL